MLVCSGCSSPYPQPPAVRYGPPADDVSHWDGDHLTGSPTVRISLSEQRAYLYKGGQLAGVSLISSGREGLDTVTGDFRILEKDEDHRSSVFGDYLDANGRVIQKDVDTSKHPMPKGAHYEGADMPNWMRIVGGTGMHAGFLPGYPASHGCIRMPPFMAEHFYRSVTVGTPVSIGSAMTYDSPTIRSSL
jgi:lipoprotein-anchoring transpeptidase ErfK/SrfK